MALRRSDRGTPIWDVPLRIFHWLLALLVAAQVVTASIGVTAMQVHACGRYTQPALVQFRVRGGFSGGPHAPFPIFCPGQAGSVV